MLVLGVKNEIIQLGCQYGNQHIVYRLYSELFVSHSFCVLKTKIGLASKFTSYVTVDPNEQKDLKESLMMMKSRDVPVQFALGWGGLSTDWECADGYSSEEGE